MDLPKFRRPQPRDVAMWGMGTAVFFGVAQLQITQLEQNKHFEHSPIEAQYVSLKRDLLNVWCKGSDGDYVPEIKTQADYNDIAKRLDCRVYPKAKLFKDVPDAESARFAAGDVETQYRNVARGFAVVQCKDEASGNNYVPMIAGREDYRAVMQSRACFGKPYSTRLRIGFYLNSFN